MAPTPCFAHAAAIASRGYGRSAPLPLSVSSKPNSSAGISPVNSKLTAKSKRNLDRDDVQYCRCGVGEQWTKTVRGAAEVDTVGPRLRQGQIFGLLPIRHGFGGACGLLSTAVCCGDGVEICDGNLRSKRPASWLRGNGCRSRA